MARQSEKLTRQVHFLLHFSFFFVQKCYIADAKGLDHDWSWPNMKRAFLALDHCLGPVQNARQAHPGLANTPHHHRPSAILRIDLFAPPVHRKGWDLLRRPGTTAQSHSPSQQGRTAATAPPASSETSKFRGLTAPHRIPMPLP